MSIVLIAAMDKQNGIGYDNQLLCHLPKDLQHFKQQTQGNFVLFGKNTYKSIVNSLGKPLPNRDNLVLTSDKNFKTVYNNVYVYHSIDKVLQDYEKDCPPNTDLFICGGEQVYKQFLDYADKIILTIIDYEFPEADTYFTVLNQDKWNLTSSEHYSKDEYNPYNFTINTYHKK